MSACGTKPTSPSRGSVSASRGKADMTRTGSHFRVDPERTWGTVYSITSSAHAAGACP